MNDNNMFQYSIIQYPALTYTLQEQSVLSPSSPQPVTVCTKACRGAGGAGVHDGTSHSHMRAGTLAGLPGCARMRSKT